MKIEATMTRAIKVFAVMEADTVTGPAKNLIEFCRHARSLSRQSMSLPDVATTIATFHRGKDAESNRFVAAARGEGIEADVIGEGFRFDPRVIPALRRAVHRRAPDIIQTHNVKSHFLVWLSGLWRERPWVAFQHGYTATDLKQRAYNQLDRWSLGAAHRVITVSHAFARELARTGVAGERIRVLHNSVDRERFAARGAGEMLRPHLGIRDDERVILAVGRLSREKGHADLVAALDHLKRTQPGLRVRLVIVGSGPERERIESTAAALGVSDQVIFAGHVTDVSPYYEMADAMALPSHSEGSPNVLLEAMAAGLPVVATSVGGVPEIVEHNLTALLVKPEDPRAMAEAIARMLEDEGLASELASNARAAVAERHSPEARTRTLLEIYSELAPHKVKNAAPFA